MKLRILFGIAALFFTITPAIYCQKSAQKAVDEFAHSPEFTHSTVAFYAMDAQTKEVLASYNGQTSIPTASTVKLFATSAALEILGPSYRPSTRIYSDGPVVNGILKGNLWIRGGGDPSLGSKHFTESGREADFLKLWSDSLKNMGIQTIEGDIIADASDFEYSGVPDGWSWNDMGNYYGAGPAGICIFDNMVSYWFKTESTPGSPTTLLSTFPIINDLIFHNNIRSEKVSGDQSYLFGGPYSLDRFGTGSLPLSQSRFEVKGSLPDPEYQLAIELKQVLQKNGIIVRGAPKAVRQSNGKLNATYDQSMRLLLTHKGATVQQLVEQTNLKSVNLFAEQLLYLISYVKTGRGSTEGGIRLVEDHLQGKMDIGGLFLKDGSGLSRSNGISAKHYVDLLNSMLPSKNYTTFFSSLPVSGKTGTLTSLCKDQQCQGRIVAKSGTMSRIKSYAGYIQTKSGRKLIFAVIVNNFDGGSARTVEKMEKLFNELVAL